MVRVHKKKKELVRDYILLIAGTGLIALAVQAVFDPMGMVTGGFTGIGILIRRLTLSVVPGGIPVWLTNLLLNLPAFVAAWFIMGKVFVKRTAIAAVLLSAWLAVIPVMDLADGDYLLAAIYGGVISGVGIALVLRTGNATGGTDLLASLLHMKFRNYSVAQILLVLDGTIILAGFYLVGARPALYAILTVTIVTKVTDMILDGMNYSKMIFVVSDHSSEIAEHILYEMDRGCTAIPAQGMYSDEMRKMLFCVVGKKEVLDFKDCVKELDPHAFVIVTDATEVLGEGFLEY
jgi:uncharacterized membrane-anchored protein YitT (DUF2179 family)